MCFLTGQSGEKIVSIYPHRKPATKAPSKDPQPSSSNPGQCVKPVLTSVKDPSYGFGRVDTEFDMSLGMLAYVFKTQEIACNDGFDMKINNQRFVAYPKTWKARGESTNYQISIVFALKNGCEQHTASAYQTLSNKIAVSLVMLQNYFGFLEREDKWADNAEEPNKDHPLEEFAKTSFIVQPLAEMFEEVRNRGNIHKYLINFVELGFCDEAHALTKLNVVPKGRQEIDEIVRKMKPYHGILLLEDVWPTPDANPIVAKLLSHCSPDRSILDMSTASGIPIFEVFMIIRHLLQWTRAILIYPLCNTNIYTSATSPQPLDKMAEKFTAQFGNTIHLAAGLAHFNPPKTLDTFIRKNLPLHEQGVRAKLVVALLRHQMLMQLHQFYYILKPYSIAILPEPKEPCPAEFTKIIEESTLPNDVKGVVADICAEMLETTSYASVKRTLSLFVKVAPMMDGNHHLEEIKYKNNLDRTEIEGVFVSFKLVIATFRRPDFVAE
ncbi:GATOR complex protein NPRL3 [Caenorhabditis elegans]|nr:GATOR complex protein NPRL3 [Caenorhabditis elegans]CDO41148.1 GATOR complex protein NPRL3 [Caenorhabditis elegans]|eukprot:NP_001294069.1 GATOR complex protein NPRL3 [Caenorhabditis elegans]